jgi:hypothetical protein
MTAAQWYGGPWNGAVIYTGTWLNKYVAIVEPPTRGGKVRVKRVKRTGRRLLPAARAMERARQAIRDRRLAERRQYALLAHPDVEMLPPMLVREELARSRAQQVPYYYIVPFALRREWGDRGGRLARVCVLVNAFTGDFEEITAFGGPVEYLSREEALNVVGSALRTDRRGLRDAEVTLMFQPSDITHVRTFPFWRIKVGAKTFYVDQLGKFYGKLLPSIPGD